MLDKLIQRLTYANVMSTLAVFIALGGSSYAAMTINGSSIRNRSIRAAKLRYDTLGGREVRESALGRVPFASDAERLGGLTAGDFKIRCPRDTFTIGDVCSSGRRDRRPPTVAPCSNVGWPASRRHRAGGCRHMASCGQRSRRCNSRPEES